MKTLPAILLLTLSLRAADHPQLQALRAADDERAAAILAADKARLDAIFSDELRYAHSGGNVDDKAAYMDSIVSGKLKYLAIEYKERNFTFPAPGIALMTARIRMKSTSAAGETDALFSILAVWREEKGKWRFLAWQSSKLAPPAPPK